MLLQNPNLKAIYAPWAEPAAGVLQAIRTAHRTDIAVGTMDLSNTVAVSLGQGGAIKALMVDDPYSIGKSLVAEIGYSLIGKATPAYIQVPAIPVAKASLLGLFRELPREALARGDSGNGSVVTRDRRVAVLAGLDPAIHVLPRKGNTRLQFHKRVCGFGRLVVHALRPACGEKVADRPDEGVSYQPLIRAFHLLPANAGRRAG